MLPKPVSDADSHGLNLAHAWPPPRCELSARTLIRSPHPGRLGVPACALQRLSAPAAPLHRCTGLRPSDQVPRATFRRPCKSGSAPKYAAQFTFSTLGLADGIPDYDWSAKDDANGDIFMHGKGEGYRACIDYCEQRNARNHRLRNA